MQVKEKVKSRPTEAVTGIALAGVVYAFLVERGVPDGSAVIVAVIIAFGPALVSEIVDAVRND